MSTDKTLDTLIPDIYDKLAVLNTKDKLEISDEELDFTAANMREAIDHWCTPQNHDTFTLRMSNIGQPTRRLWMDSRDKHSEDHSPATQLKFLYGHLLEQVVLMLCRVAGHEVTDTQKEVEIDGIKGHMDSKIDGEVVDVKTASSFAFLKFVRGTLAENDPYGYMGQLAGYEAAENTSAGGFLVLNKESGQLCLNRPDDLDKPDIRARIAEVKAAIELDTPPEICYDPVPHGAKGNMKLASGCTWCPHKHKCFDDLRTFRYSKGPVYFTKVVVEPNVEEML